MPEMAQHPAPRMVPGLFSSPQGVAVDSDGNLYVADTAGNPMVCRISGVNYFSLCMEAAG